MRCFDQLVSKLKREYEYGFEKLKSIEMAKGEVVISYLTRISHVRDELVAVGEVVPNAELVQTAMNGVSNPWVVFMEALVARENLPT